MAEQNKYTRYLNKMKEQYKNNIAEYEVDDDYPSYEEVTSWAIFQESFSICEFCKTADCDCDCDIEDSMTFEEIEEYREMIKSIEKAIRLKVSNNYEKYYTQYLEEHYY